MRWIKQPDWASLYGVDPLLQRLVDAHPLVFRGRLPRCQSYVVPAWYDLVDKLLTDIEQELGPAGCRFLQIGQIKEKWGSLRLHCLLPARLRAVHGDRLRRLVDAAEVKSERLLTREVATQQ